MPSHSKAFLILLLPLVAQACSSVPEPERDPAIEQKALEDRRERDAILARQNDIHLVLLRMDEALSEYTVQVAQSENIKAERRAEALREYLEFQSKRFMKELLTFLHDADVPRNRSIAAGALGFTGSEEAVAPLLNALSDPEPFVRTNACLGLGTLANPRTPLDTLNQLCLDVEQPIEVRRAASWTLLQLQEAGSPSPNFTALWPRLLEGDILAMDSVLALHGLRGLGLLREPAVLDAALRYFSHPQPLIRQAALIAAGRSKNRAAAEKILPFLYPEEPNPNVRLTARKALKALTGNRIDHGYDPDAWRNEFDLDRKDGA